MRQVWITRAGQPEVLQVKEAPDPTPGAGQVRIRVRAAGINFADLMARVGMYPDAPKLPCVVGYEVAGVIDAVGEGVTGLREGDRVFGMPRFGGYTDTLVLGQAQVFPMPAAMSFEEAAALPVAYLTAHHMMFVVGNLREGGRILIHSAAGGVGIAAVQLAKTKRAEIFGTASTSKHDFLREIGVAHPLDSSADVPAQARAAIAASGDKGLDMVLDPVGGPSWREGYDLLGAAGHLVAFGLSSASSGKSRSLLTAIGRIVRTPRFNPLKMMDENKTVSGVNMGHLFDRLDLLTPQFHALIALYEQGAIKPHVDRTFPFAEAAAAHHWIHDRKAKGKVLLVP